MIVVYITFLKGPKIPCLFSISNPEQAKYILQKHLKYRDSSTTKYQVCVITTYHFACLQSDLTRPSFFFLFCSIPAVKERQYSRISVSFSTQQYPNI